VDTEPVAAQILDKGDGEALSFLNDSVMTLKLSDDSAGPAFYEYRCPPAATAAPPHVHHGHDETFYVVEGSFEFAVGDNVRVLGPGGFVSVPRETPHAFRNAGASAGRIVGTLTPGHFAQYFRELALIIDATGQPPAKAQWAELYARYDTAFAD
jgi:mannose-6-phosphate isomerase-like protein (cupin superfamily)